MSAVVYANEADFKEKISRIRVAGDNQLHVVADFDKTLTVGHMVGRRSTSTWDSFTLSPDYMAKQREMYEYYRPIEIDPSIELEKKKVAMKEWWNRHLDLLIDCGLTFQGIKKAVDDGAIIPRRGFSDLLELLSQRGIPLLIFSAGLGDVISEYLNRQGLITPTLHIISNFFEFDASGKAIKFKGNPIHSFNKSENELSHEPYRKSIEERRNLILLGDTLGDANMATGLSHDTIIRIGFLNGYKEHLDEFLKVYDLVVVEDDGLEEVIDLLS